MRQMYSFECFTENLIYFQRKSWYKANIIDLLFSPNLCFRSAWLVDWSQMNSLFNPVHHFFNSLSLQICNLFTCSKNQSISHSRYQLQRNSANKELLNNSWTACLPCTASYHYHKWWVLMTKQHLLIQTNLHSCLYMDAYCSCTTQIHAFSQFHRESK